MNPNGIQNNSDAIDHQINQNTFIVKKPEQKESNQQEFNPVDNVKSTNTNWQE